MNDPIYDICIVGSGAGGSPIAFELVNAGFNVVMLEKGPHLTTEKFTKDELLSIRRPGYTPNLKDEFHIVEKKQGENWKASSTYKSRNSLWNGNMVGGATNLMSGYFHRMKPIDFKLKTTLGEWKGINRADWPIGYEDLEPYYEKVERLVGVSGEVTSHPYQEPRSTNNFPYPKLLVNPLANRLQQAGDTLNLGVFDSPRAILSAGEGQRKSCFYSNYCGSYGCASDAKGSARSALLNKLLGKENFTLIANAKVSFLETDGHYNIRHAHYIHGGAKKKINARYFVLAAQAIETSRLLLMSKNKDFPNGVANFNGQVGKNLIFSRIAGGYGNYLKSDFDPQTFASYQTPGLFINKSTQKWYSSSGQNPVKGGTIDFLLEHANPISKAVKFRKDTNGNLVFGDQLMQKLENHFKDTVQLKFEVFLDWEPNDNCFVSLDDRAKDKWGDVVARIRLGAANLDLDKKRLQQNWVAEMLNQSEQLLKQTGAALTTSFQTQLPATNLQGGGCRFGLDANETVLDVNCRAHHCSNLFVTDGSFMPTGGSVPFTHTIYANSFRIADYLKSHL